jgi:hypothetical protein
MVESFLFVIVLFEHLNFAFCRIELCVQAFLTAQTVILDVASPPKSLSRPQLASLGLLSLLVGWVRTNRWGVGEEGSNRDHWTLSRFIFMGRGSVFSGEYVKFQINRFEVLKFGEIGRGRNEVPRVCVGSEFLKCTK